MTAAAYPAFRATPVALQSSSGGGGFFFLFRMIVFTIVPLLAVNAVLPQLEMAMSGGRVPVSTAFLKIALLGIFLMAFTFRGLRVRGNPRIFTAALVFFGYLMLDSLHLYFDLGILPLDIALGYNTYYVVAFLTVLALLIPLRVRDQYVLAVITLLAIATTLVGLAQFIKRQPILPVASSDQHFQVVAYTSTSRFRVFSLFDEPATCALFYVLLATLMIAFCRRPKYRPFAIVGLGACIFMCLISDARTQIAALACGMLSAVILTFWHKSGRSRYLPVVALLSGIPVGLYAYYKTTMTIHTSSVTDAASFASRLKEWTYYLQVLRALPWTTVLFGMGIVQNTKLASINAAVYMDNIYLSVGMHIGVVGLILYLVFVWCLWEEIRRRAELQTSYLHTAVAATFSIFFMMGLFTNVSGMLFSYFLLYAISDAYDPTVLLKPKASTSLVKAPGALAMRA